MQTHTHAQYSCSFHAQHGDLCGPPVGQQQTAHNTGVCFFSQYFLTILHSIYHGDARICAHRNITALSAHKLRIYRKCDSDKNKKTFLITCMELIIIVGLWKNRQSNTPKLNGPADIVWDTQSLFMEYGILRVSLFLVFVNWWFHSRSSQWIGFYCIAVQDREC